MAAPQAPEHVRACIILQDGTLPYAIEIPMITNDHLWALNFYVGPGIRKNEYSIEKLRMLASGGIIWRGDIDPYKHEPKLATSTLPKCPEGWDEKAWEHRVTFGNNKFHLFITPAKGEGPLRRILGTNSHFPVRGDAVVMKVSSELVDGRSSYEDIGDVKSKELSLELTIFITQVAELLRSLGF